MAPAMVSLLHLCSPTNYPRDPQERHQKKILSTHPTHERRYLCIVSKSETAATRHWRALTTAVAERVPHPKPPHSASTQHTCSAEWTGARRRTRCSDVTVTRFRCGCSARARLRGRLPDSASDAFPAPTDPSRRTSRPRENFGVAVGGGSLPIPSPVLTPAFRFPRRTSPPPPPPCAPSPHARRRAGGGRRRSNARTCRGGRQCPAHPCHRAARRGSSSLRRRCW